MGDPSIDILTQRLAEADIDPQLRDTLASDLDWAMQINGHPDSAMQGVKRLVVSGIRRELLACEDRRQTHKDIADIIATCAARHAAGIGAEPAGNRTANALRLISALRPFGWPAAFACFSPFAGEVLGKVLAFFAN